MMKFMDTSARVAGLRRLQRKANLSGQTSTRRFIGRVRTSSRPLAQRMPGVPSLQTIAYGLSLNLGFTAGDVQTAWAAATTTVIDDACLRLIQAGHGLLPGAGETAELRNIKGDLKTCRANISGGVQGQGATRFTQELTRRIAALLEQIRQQAYAPANAGGQNPGLARNFY